VPPLETQAYGFVRQQRACHCNSPFHLAGRSCRTLISTGAAACTPYLPALSLLGATGQNAASRAVKGINALIFALLDLLMPFRKVFNHAFNTLLRLVLTMVSRYNN